MGTYLSTPVLDKHTEKGSDLTDTNTPVRWAVVDMQGWRKSMEDAHVARTDVTLPSRCFSGGGGKLLGNADGGDGGSGGEGGAASASATIDGGAATAASNNDNDAASIQQQHQHAKVFAVFDGHGGAEVARYCQLHLVPVLTSQSQWKDSNANEHEGGGDADDGDSDMSMASCIGHALIDSFHALDRMIDDPNSRGEIEKWRSVRPPPYVAGKEKESSSPMEEEEEEESDAIDEERNTVLDPNDISEDTAKSGHMIFDGADDDEESSDDSSNENNNEGEEKKGEIADMEEEDKKNVNNNLANMLDDDDEILEDDDDNNISKLTEDSDNNMENKQSDGIIHDDSDEEDDDDKKEERTNANENDDGEVVEEITTPGAADGKEEKAASSAAGTMVLSANDAVALFQKLLHMNGPSDAKNAGGDDDEEEEDDDDDNGQADIGDAGEGENDNGGDGGEVAIPTREQLLNPPSGIVAPSASVPTRIQNGRKICNLPDHPIHAGCTSVVAVIVGRTLVVANAGDSRAVLCRAGGLTEPLSFDHKPLQNREMNRITNSGGFVNQFGRVNGNLNLSRSIGDLKYKQVPGIPPAEQTITAEPDILCTTLRAGDEFIVLGCDGIWDCLTNEECVKYVRDRIDSKHPHEIGMEMLDEIVSADPRASQGIGGDNMTIMIVDLLPHSRPYHGGGSNE